VVFVLLTAAQGWLGGTAVYWLYLVKTLVGAWLIWTVRPLVAEMRWAFSWPALLVGIGVFVIWVGVTGDFANQATLWHRLGLAQAPATPAPEWNPPAVFGSAAPLAWFFIAVRLIGSTLVVPPIEEAFYRSFLYRYLSRVDFLAVPLRQFSPLPFVVTALVFGLMHHEWLAGIVCGAAYQWLVLRRGDLGEAMTAHAVTNLLLGIWVVTRGAWQFW
ncbi:MAG TPA: CAAX prenyl protease-related protein, partial [Verrucomicrobiae bacterium]